MVFDTKIIFYQTFYTLFRWQSWRRPKATGVLSAGAEVPTPAPPEIWKNKQLKCLVFY
jgi:hypothetical protein